MSTYCYLLWNGTTMIDKPKNLKAFKFLPWRMVTFAVFIYPCLYQAKIYTIVIICLFSEIRLQVIDYLILNLENHLQR